MSSKTLSARVATLTLLTAGVSAPLTAPLTAQTTAILGPSNAPYIEGLWRAGYIDHAVKVGELVAASNLPEAEKKAVDAVYTELKKALARRDGDALARRDLVLKTIAEKTAAMKAGDVKAEATSGLVLEIVEQYRQLADALVEALGKEQDAEKAATLRKDADAMFKSVEAEFTARKADTEKLRDDTKPGTEVPFMVCCYGLGRLHYYHSLLHPAESLQSKHEVELALATLEDFELDFSDTLTGFEAKLAQALCHKRLGNVEAALGACDDAFKLYERFEKPSQIDKEAADVIAMAALQKSMFLEEMKENAKIVELGKDFFAKVPKAMEADQGPAVLAAMAKAHIALGDNEAATKEAKQLIELGGRWGFRGTELLSDLTGGPGGAPTGGVAEMVKMAEQLAGQGDFPGALRMCRQVQLRADPKSEEKQIVDSMMITGVVFAMRQWYHEASVAYEEVVRRYPKADAAPEALWRQINCFIQLNQTENATGKLPVLKRWIEEKSRQLKTEYPTDPRVPALVLLDGDQLEKANKSLEAAKIYEAIPADSTVYYEARYKAAGSYLSHARSLANSNREKDAEPFLEKARAGFVAVISEVETKLPSIGDKALKQRLESVMFNSCVSLAGLYLSGQPRPADAENVLAKVKDVEDDQKAQVVTSLRIRIKVAQEEIDQAASMMDEALAKAAQKGTPPDALLATCRSLATSLDNLALERSKKKESQAASALWKRAIAFYLKCAQKALPAEAAQIAERLRVIGMIDNKIDEKVESWYEVPDFKATNFDAWNAALQVYQELAVKEVLNYKGQVGYARVLGFLGKWNDCEGELTKLFQTEKIISGNRIDAKVVQSKRELVPAYLEYAYALDKASGGDEKGRRAKANDAFVHMLASVPANSRYWWHAKYGQIDTMFKRGDYNGADVTFKSVERTNPDFDGDQYGLKGRFGNLKIAIRSKMK